MSEPLFIQFQSPDGKSVEAAASRFLDGSRLPAGRWSVFQEGVDDRVMTVDDMPAHWIEQLRAWQNWANETI